MKKTLQVIFETLIVLIASLLSAVGLHTFVNTANFAPSGIDGVAMMLQKLTTFNMGYISLAINIPLLIVAWFFISKKYVIYTTIFTLLSSGALILMEHIKFYQYIAKTNSHFEDTVPISNLSYHIH